MRTPFLKHILLILFLLTALSVSAADHKNFFVRVIPDRTQVYVGDSLLVSVVLYAENPIARAEAKSSFEISGKCRVRSLNIDRNATASWVREGDKVFYTLVWAQYVLGPARAGKYTISRQKFNAVLQQVISMPDLFDRMMGAQPEYREYKVAANSDTFTFEVTEKPLRSTREMMSEGNVL